ncbi:type I restriction-modification system endonuclease [Pseudomarimonas arenosa]|uniref:Type I restriction-modification system endonuclease n=1 Tax=Pseudomarimonas arenosa TaxID=2774145 RepID=A0AAW3ZTI2_9GAMM|nr:type I restriction-modification system endonuclease [Pseudomarimonas arenosa]MBD8527834.1 type I restriction-modification system endonuclease [Pseudomarimonas arenosa]
MGDEQPVAASVQSNFLMLEEHDKQLMRLGMLAERYFVDDPNTCLLKLRQLTEGLAQLLASKVGLFVSVEEKQVDLLNRFQKFDVLPREVASLFHSVRKAGNDANHALSGDHRTALAMLRFSWQLCVWFHRSFADDTFRSGPFLPPRPPVDESEELRQELEQLRDELREHQASQCETSNALDQAIAQTLSLEQERKFWEDFAAQAERERFKLEERLSALQAAHQGTPAQSIAKFAFAMQTAASTLQLSEADTRKIIDQQLQQAGWQADSRRMTYANGERPKRGEAKAIAEWPTESGPADYVLFVGLRPMAVVEAKRRNLDVSSALQQAKRYSRGFQGSAETELHEENWGLKGEFRVPFVFSANGRPFLRQLATRSGIWFCDLRNAHKLGHALDGWYTPVGLNELFKRDESLAHQVLRSEPFNYGFPLRPYQQAAIQAVENAISQGQREVLLAMATGTGKTKTCIALIYRLLKAKRFRRVLFLVDRSALGEQAANAFKDTRMESLQAFADVFGIKELEQQQPDADTAVHIATVQGMALRVLFSSDGAPPPTVDQYDCIVVDECHRGYLLDRELSETELGFRNYEDYISKYRRVLDYFDAVKIGLTATPALHTTQIFGAPIYNYSYREAVIDGYLVDHEPPLQIRTKLSTTGIVWRAGEKVAVYDARSNQIELFTTPDQIRIEIEKFNRKVITEPFNRAVCNFLASELDPYSRQKTLIFCANDPHADLVVDLLKRAFVRCYGSVEDDAVLKITGAADKPLQLIRRFKNERTPNVAVTVDLLTTGIDVPEICNLVFLRRVNSRILFDQMLGRATRLCPEIGKETFRVFDAVRIYEALQNFTAMRPVVVDPSISFSQLSRELGEVSGDDERELVRDQFIAKLQRKKRHLGQAQARDFETRAGMAPDAFIQQLRAMSLPAIADWFTRNPGLGEILDRRGEGPQEPIYVSTHEDELLGADHGYGQAARPEDYLKAFADFIASHSNTIPALVTVLTRPRELTRKQLRELALELDRQGYSEASLSTAWRDLTNQDIAARIVGYIRQAAIGDALLPYAERVDRALNHLLMHPPAGTPWTTPQRDWLKRIAAQTKANVLVDREAIDDPDLIFRREGGGFNRLDKLFNGQLQPVLEAFNDALWISPSESAQP